MSVNKVFRLWDPFLDFIFFQHCVLCSNGNLPVCQSCVDKLPRASGKCFGCGAKNPFYKYCESCNKKYRPDLVIGMYKYEGAVRRLIRLFKFEDISGIAPYLSEGLGLAVGGFVSLPVVTAIPLSPKRYKHRGYNQSELLAKEIASSFGWVYKGLLKRRSSEFSQVEVKHRKRRKDNIKGVFEINTLEIPPEILLVDDVITTGATIEEATKILKKAGAKKVVVCALAMGSD